MNIMKNNKIFILAIGLGLLLIAGQQHAVVAAYNDNSNLDESIAPNQFLSSGQDYSVEIISVGPSAVENYTAVSDGYYEIESDKVITMVRLSADVQGFNGYELNFAALNESYYDYVANETAYMDANVTLNNVAYAGELYLVVNGEVARASASFLTSKGTDLGLTQGINTVSLLYVGRDQDGSVTWAEDTVNINVIPVDGVVDTFDVVDLPYENYVTDLADDSPDTIDITNILYWSWGDLARNKVFEPLVDVTVGYNGTDEEFGYNEGNELIVASDDGGIDGTLEFHGVVDTSGFHGTYHFENFDLASFSYTDAALAPRTQGVTLVQDAHGLQLLEETGNVVYWSFDNADDTQDRSYSQVSIVALADYGTWDLSVDYSGYGVDWDGQFSSVKLDSTSSGASSFNTSTTATNYTGWGPGANETLTIAEPNHRDEFILAALYGWSGGLYGTNDFETESSSFIVKGMVGDISTVSFTTITNTETSTAVTTNTTSTTSTNTSTVTDTVTGQVSETVVSNTTISDVEGAPGFGVVLTLVTVGTIAYIAPRMKKE
jgi:hypothetical protein